MNAAPFWVTFGNGSAACVEVPESEIAQESLRLDWINRNYGETRGGVVLALILPYPASPRLNRVTECPSFCRTPYECAGRMACPQRPRSCVS